MFLLACAECGGGEGVQKLKLKLESKSKPELGANLMRHFMRVHYPLPRLLLPPPIPLPALARDDDDCSADNDKAGVGCMCVQGRGVARA